MLNMLMVILILLISPDFYLTSLFKQPLRKEEISPILMTLMMQIYSFLKNVR